MKKISKLQKLWLLERFAAPGTDEKSSVIVRAPSLEMARKLASQERSDEDPDEWLNLHKSCCSRLKDEGPTKIILTDFNAG